MRRKRDLKNARRVDAAAPRVSKKFGARREGRSVLAAGFRARSKLSRRASSVSWKCASTGRAAKRFAYPVRVKRQRRVAAVREVGISSSPDASRVAREQKKEKRRRLFVFERGGQTKRAFGGKPAARTIPR